MIPNNLKTWAPSLIKTFTLTVIAFSGFYTQLAYADVPNVATMLANISADVPQFMQLVTASSYVMGMWMIFRGVSGMKAFGEQRSQMSTHTELKSAIVLLTVGTGLLYLPSSVQAGLTTFWTDPNPYGYVTEASDDFSAMYQDAFLVIQLIGTIAFIRGLLTLSQMAGHQGQPGVLAKGFTYIIAGICCINLNDFLAAINGSLGITGIISNG
jgi:intracellular multiplication protein IcmC